MRNNNSRFAIFVVAVIVWGCSPARADFMYVSFNDNTISRIDTTTQVSSSVVSSGLSGTRGMAFDAAGNLYVSDANASGGSIVEITPGGVTSVFASGNLLSSPEGLAFDASGNLYVANNANNPANDSIVRFSPGGVGTLVANIGSYTPHGLAIDKAGNIYVANEASSTIERFTPGGVGSLFASTGLNHPTGLAFDAAGNLYVANSGSNNIEEFTPDGVGSVFATTGQDPPLGLAFDSEGNLYSGTFAGDNTIMRFTPNGVESVFATESSPPLYLAFQSTSSVPEPSSLILLSMGALLVAGRVAGKLAPPPVKPLRRKRWPLPVSNDAAFAAHGHQCRQG